MGIGTVKSHPACTKLQLLNLSCFQKVRPTMSADKFVKPTALPPPKSPSPVGGPPSPMQTNVHPVSPASQRSQSPMQVDPKGGGQSSKT